MPIRRLSLATVLCALALATVAPAQDQLTLDDIFPRKGYTGKAAQSLAWSHDDRYLAYRWNPYDDKGYDLWLYDTKSGKSLRLTSMDVLEPFDREVPKARERYKKEAEEEQKVLRMSNDEYREYRIKKREEDEKRKEPLPSYPGVSEFAWGKKSNQILFVYKGDIYHLKSPEAKPERLTKTRGQEAQVEFVDDDRAFLYREGGGIYRRAFGDTFVQQLNPPLPNGGDVDRYWLSPDGSRMIIVSSKSKGPSRQVDYIVYRDRFAQARKTDRDVADDPFNYETTIYCADVDRGPGEDPKTDGKPWEVWKFPGGEELIYDIVGEKPWSPDSKKFVFATYKRDQKVFEVFEADPAAKKLEPLYKATMDGEHTTATLANPTYLPDGSKILLLMDLSGFRHAWLLDPKTKGVTQLTKGDFELYPDRVSKDGTTLFVHAQKEHPARMDLYAVDLATGQMRRLTAKDGVYENPEYSHDGRWAAAMHRSWTFRPELVLVDAKNPGQERTLTASHRPGFEKVYKLQPQLFSYVNRHGQTIHGYIYLPPGHRKEDKRPLWINVYGGPLTTGKSVNDGAISLVDVYMAYTLGMVVATIDPRGQSGYGNVFGKANFEQPGKPQVEDLVDGVRYIQQTWGTDPAKTAVSGWSFGGFQAQMCMYTAPDVFTLGVAGAGPTQWQNYNNWYSGGVIGKSRIGKPEDLDKFSLTHVAKNLRSPLLLIHGMEDLNVLFQDTVAVYRELLKWGKGPLVELVVDPTGGHGLGGDIDYREQIEIMLQFVRKWWGVAPPPPAKKD
ncbi:MAG: prolyl oligopeptidase family serine peptidase [Armatimonadetes bacterium]|nr:prolyl oligopeptidase family serine peptidase [Armatimonadota bacterium]MCA1995728.1 prolyl oligopeptidase family serine peptidase [Armatimonadota bacterium]